LAVPQVARIRAASESSTVARVFLKSKPAALHLARKSLEESPVSFASVYSLIFAIFSLKPAFEDPRS
jgi:hypothetical protein